MPENYQPNRPIYGHPNSGVSPAWFMASPKVAKNSKNRGSNTTAMAFVTTTSACKLQSGPWMLRPRSYIFHRNSYTVLPGLPTSTSSCPTTFTSNYCSPRKGSPGNSEAENDGKNPLHRASHRTPKSEENSLKQGPAKGTRKSTEDHARLV
jgi:hypothetical protein